MKCEKCQTINSVVTETCAGCGADLKSNQSESLQSRPPSQIMPETARGYAPYVLLAMAIIYTISPVDLIPDIPIVGWIDDLIFLTLAGTHFMEKGTGIQSQHLKETLRLVKWVVAIVGVIAIAVLSLLGIVIYKLVWG
ncbi:MAG TPA: YkvA family protein [Blastocatellia bacterium]|nr:YkvA family protein [Blastocatellia bacterium]